MLTIDTLYDTVYDTVIHILTLYSAVCSWIIRLSCPFVWYSDTMIHCMIQWYTFLPCIQPSVHVWTWIILLSCPFVWYSDTLYDTLYDTVIHILTLYSAVCSCLDLDNSVILPFCMIQWYNDTFYDTVIHILTLYSAVCSCLDLDNSVILPFCSLTSWNKTTRLMKWYLKYHLSKITLNW